MDLGQIVVMIVFIIFCVGGFFLIKKANQELAKESNKDKVISVTVDQVKEEGSQNKK